MVGYPLKRLNDGQPIKCAFELWATFTMCVSMVGEPKMCISMVGQPLIVRWNGFPRLKCAFE